MIINVAKQSISISSPEALVSNSVGQYMARISFSDEWKDFDKIIVFRSGETSIEQAVDAQTEIIVPWEVLQKKGTLEVGAYGLKGTEKRPTIWSKPLVILQGVEEGETAHEPTILPWEEIVRRIGQLADLDTENKSSLVGAINEVLSTVPAFLSELTPDAEHMTVSQAEKNAWSAKADTSDIPTNVSELENDAGYITQEEVPEITATAINNALGYTAADNADVQENAQEISQISESIMDISETVEGKADKGYVDSEFDNLEAQLIRDAMGISAQAYNRAMRNWFRKHGENVVTPEGITALCEEWYHITRDNWCGWVTFSDPDISTVSDGVKGGDNAGLVCEPSTDTYAGRDDYAGLPLFAISTVNWILDRDGNILITAIKGIHDTYEQDNPEKFVGVMQMSAWTFQRRDNTSYTYGYCSRPNEIDECKPLPEAIKLDGSMREFVVHSKYMSTTVDGKMTSCSGLVPTRNNSHNSLIALPDSIGTKYSAGTSVDWSFIVWMAFIKYGSMTQDAKNQGCVSYNYQYYAKLSENGVNRIALTRAEAANIEIGSTVLLGAYAGNADRGHSAVSNISGINGRIVTAVENVVIGGNEYGLIYVDGAPFDTAANGNAMTGSTILSTYHWRSGMNDSVLGNDGSIGSASNGRHPAMIQGIEYSVGGYEVMVDAILSIESGYYVPYIARLKQYQATSVTPNMTKVAALKSAQPASDAWRYIRKVEYSDGIFFAVDTDGEGNFAGSSAKYTRDGFYKNGTATVSALRVWLAFGYLYIGSGTGGLCFFAGHNALSYAPWYFLARLSPNGNRGEFMA